MPVRGTTHAKHLKNLIVMQEVDQGFEGERIWCAWADCDNKAYSIYQFVVNEAKPQFPVKLARYAFCSEQCMEYFKRSHIPGQYGKLPAHLRSRYM